VSTADHEAEAARLVQSLEQYLSLRGYGFIAISIAKLVRDGEQVATPGASTLAVAPEMMPAVPHEARALRACADKLDVMFRESGSHEAQEGYIEDATQLYYPKTGRETS
jgi:hypothetical protein